MRRRERRRRRVEEKGEEREEEEEEGKHTHTHTFHCSLSGSSLAWHHSSPLPGQRRRWVQPECASGNWVSLPFSLSEHLQTCVEGRQLGLLAE